MSIVINPKSRATTGKHSHKVPKAAVDLIIEMTLENASNKQILQTIKLRFGLTLHENMLSYYRRRRAVELSEAYEDQILEARVSCHLAFLPGRMAELQQVIEKEHSKGDRASSKSIIQAIDVAGKMMYKAENLRLAYREAALKASGGIGGPDEQILQEMERRSHIK